MADNRGKRLKLSQYHSFMYILFYFTFYSSSGKGDVKFTIINAQGFVEVECSLCMLEQSKSLW